MSFYSINSEIELPISLNDAWTFFSDPNNLSKITPDEMNFEITNGKPKPMFEGQIITYKVSPLKGFRMSWMTEITVVKENSYFIDEQRFGPYALWHHKHSFEPIDSGVVMRDLVNYKLPWGFIGAIAHKLFIRKRLEGIFSYRAKVLKEKFGLLK